MIDHVKTLLLNESASYLVSAFPDLVSWPIDQSFTAVKLGPGMESLYNMVFPYTNLTPRGMVAGKLDAIGRLMPYINAPELATSLSVFDGRVSSDSPHPSDVFGFHSVMSGSSSCASELALLSNDAMEAFYPTGVGRLDPVLASLKAKFQNSTASSAKIGAAAISMAIQIEALRLRSAKW